MEKKTCFVISPIGPEDSEIRRDADDFLELLIEPALAPYDFNVIRADKISRPTIITADIISLVQQADLCVIDLTGHNANVYYECGRRHETGLPFIQLIRKGDDLLFDVAGIRTIHYDLADPRSTLNSVKEIQGFVGAIEAEGYSESSSGESLGSISDALRRLERKVNRLVGSGQEPAIGRGSSKPAEISDYLLEHPRIAFRKAFGEGNLDIAAELLPRIRKVSGPTAMADAGAYLARAGERIGKSTLVELLQQGEELPVEALMIASYGLREYYYNTDTEVEGIEFFSNLIRERSRLGQGDDEQMANLLNQLQILKYSLKQYDSAENDLLRAISLVPENAVYHYNLALIYERVGRREDWEACIDRMMLLEGLGEKHLRHMMKAYREFGREEDARKVEVMLVRLAEVDPSAGGLE